ncbi:alpha/beta fold hydrolase [Nocardia sp. NPDC051321]|uniref:alpha/beta fold hydrolase n=1 Tax=Nocardia sp. NPDC051321 TaxID=3364323 RepID=UPI0037952480
MTIVFVHGVPESDAIWGPLRSELGRDDTICLSPPGFGARLPDGFGATMPEYRDWLAHELEMIGEPVDLIGHDWGGLHTLNVAIHRPDLLRSWASDAIGCLDPDYVWHSLAQVWQQPGEGEKQVDAMMQAPREARIESNRRFGMPAAVATTVAAAQTAEMGRAILALYRSAAQPAMAIVGKDIDKAAARPGLCIIPTEDPFVGTVDQRTRSGQRAGARIATLTSLGHWWMLQDPVRGAAVLDEFLSQRP